jgi:hypothetical protein
VYRDWKLSLLFVYVRSLPPMVYETKPKFGIEKLGAACVYPCSNMLIVACCGIPPTGVEPSTLVQLQKWFISWDDWFGCDVPPADVLLD